MRRWGSRNIMWQYRWYINEDVQILVSEFLDFRCFLRITEILQKYYKKYSGRMTRYYFSAKI